MRGPSLERNWRPVVPSDETPVPEIPEETPDPHIIDVNRRGRDNAQRRRDGEQQPLRIDRPPMEYYPPAPEEPNRGGNGDGTVNIDYRVDGPTQQ